MNGDCFGRARELFLAACELPADERSLFLDRACGDDAELRSEVVELLRFHQDEATGPADSMTLDLTTSSTDMPATIGPYRLLQKVGEGGMGEVYEAEQEQPIRRRVALKVIKWGMDTKQVVARFESERQALALMDHPCIARVYDAGATDKGRPYFAMEFVRGIPITEYCDRNRLSPRERLELIVQVCHGVQHAHQKGVIHRDIKPSNILVTVADAGPVPKIIDFGIAKATSQRLTERTVFTELGQWIGTPEYMSPEQADLTALDIDTRSDVYSLGVLLYELLVGAQPFDSEELRQSGFDEMRRKIREQDPQRPSTRVSSLGEASTAAADNRRTDPPDLARILRGDLDWITMRSLEKDRTRRYGSPADLAADIERHLRDEPVLASPPSTVYRLRKFVRRNRAAVVAGGLVIAALVAGLAVATVGMVRAQRAEQVANVQVELLIGLFDALDPGGESGGTASTDEILAAAEDRIDRELSQQPLVRAQLMATMGRIYSNLGSHEQARQLLEEVVTIRQEALGPDHPDVASSLRSLGGLYGVMGDSRAAAHTLERALEIDERTLGKDHTETAETLNTLAFELWRNGDFERAGPLFDRALAVRERSFGPEHLVVGDTLFMQGILLRDTGDYERARAAFERALAIREATLGPDHTQVAWTLENFGFLLALIGEREQARQHYERALAIQERVFGPDHYSVIEPSLRLGTLLLESGDVEGASRHCERALAVHERRYGDHYFVAFSLDALGRVAQRTGDHGRAQELFERGLRLREAALGANHRLVAASLYWLGGLAFETGANHRARELHQRRLRIVEQRHGSDTAEAARARIAVAWTHVRTGDVDEARRLYRSAVDSAVGSLERSPADAPRWHYNQACLAALVGEKEEALVLLRRSLDAGFASEIIANDSDLDSLRDTPEFRAMAAEVQGRGGG